MTRWLTRMAWWSANSPRLALLILGCLAGSLLWAVPAPILRLDGMWLTESAHAGRWSTIAVRLDAGSALATGRPPPQQVVEQLHAGLLGTPGLQKGDLLSPLLEPQLTDLVFKDSANYRWSGLELFRPPEGAASILFVVVYRSDDARRHILATLEMVRARFPQVRVTPVSAHLAQEELGRAALGDLIKGVPIAIGLLGVLLSFVFRSLTIATVCLIEAGLSVGLACLVGISAQVPIYVTTLVAPILTLTLGLADDIYFISMMKQAVRPHRSTQRVVLRASQAAAWPLAVSAACLLAGLAIIALGEAAPFRSFALFGILSVGTSFLMTFTVIPAALSLLPPGWAATVVRPLIPALRDGPIGRRSFRGQLVHARVLYLVVVASAAVGLTRLKVSDSWLSVLPENSEAVRASKAMSASFGGDAIIAVDLLYPGAAGVTGTHLDALGELKAAALQQRNTVAALAIDDFTHALLPEDPTKRHGAEARARAIRAFGGAVASLGLYDVSAVGTRLRVLLVGRDMTSADFLELKRRLHAWQRAHRERVSMELLSEQFEQAEGISAAVGAQVRSMALGLFLVGLVALWSGSTAKDVLRLMLGCAAVVLASYGLCGWIGIDLGISTALFGTVVIAIGTGFGLYATPYGGERARSGATTNAILHCSVVVATGLLPMAFGGAPPMARLSMMIATGAFLSALFVVLFTPAMRGESAQ